MFFWRSDCPQWRATGWEISGIPTSPTIWAWWCLDQPTIGFSKMHPWNGSQDVILNHMWHVGRSSTSRFLNGFCGVGLSQAISARFGAPGWHPKCCFTFGQHSLCWSLSQLISTHPNSSIPPKARQETDQRWPKSQLWDTLNAKAMTSGLIFNPDFTTKKPLILGSKLPLDQSSKCPNSWMIHDDPIYYPICLTCLKNFKDLNWINWTVLQDHGHQAFQPLRAHRGRGNAAARPVMGEISGLPEVGWPFLRDFLREIMGNPQNFRLLVKSKTNKTICFHGNIGGLLTATPMFGWWEPRC